MMDHQQFKELWQDDRLVTVDRESDDSWRHGSYITEVFKDEETGKFWQADYRKSGDGEYHGIRDNDFEFCEVEPVEEVVTITRFIQKKETN